MDVPVAVPPSPAPDQDPGPGPDPFPDAVEAWSPSTADAPIAFAPVEAVPYPDLFDGPAPSADQRHRSRRGLLVAFAGIAVVVLLGAVAVVLVLAGARGSTLDTAAIESDIAGRLSAEAGGVVTATCPESVPLQADSEFDVRRDGQRRLARHRLRAPARRPGQRVLAHRRLTRVPSSRSRSPRSVAVVHPLKAGGLDFARQRLSGWAADAEVPAPTVVATTPEETGTAQALAAVDDGVELVVVWGGDGTVRAVAEALVGTGVPIGVIPGGTGNLLCRNLGIPLGLRDSARVAFTGADRAVDVVEVGLGGAPG